MSGGKQLIDASYKVKRIRANSRVVCYIGAKDGPAVPGTVKW